VCAVPGAEAAARVSGRELVARAFPATGDGALTEDAARLVLKEASRYRALAIGPGLGRTPETAAAVRRIVAEAPVPLVIDADALHALADDLAPLRVRRAADLPGAVLTPHAGEYGRLAGAPLGPDRIDAARALATRTDSVVVLKGPGTVIAEPGGATVVNPTDSAALATAGTGDILTGIVAGLLANGADPFAAAVSAAYLQGAAAARIAPAVSLVAMDLLDAIAPTLLAVSSASVTREA
jgi:NAD(P)H-hydrate epimerase